MTNEIIRKLNEHIEQGLTKESDVAYVLSQLGKLVERESPKPAPVYSVLRFYRNWIVHEKLDHVNANPPMRAILASFNALLRAGQFGGNTTQPARQIADSISLRRLEAEINQVFDDFPAFDRTRVQRPENWPDFRHLLWSILADIALRADSNFQYVRELRIDSANNRFDTLVLIDNAGEAMAVPLMP
jgi:hypothetical protein